MSDDHAASQLRLLLRAAERAVALTKTLGIRGRTLGSTVKIQGVVAQAWLEGYIQATDDLEAHMKETDVKPTSR